MFSTDTGTISTAAGIGCIEPSTNSYPSKSQLYDSPDKDWHGVGASADLMTLIAPSKSEEKLYISRDGGDIWNILNDNIGEECVQVICNVDCSEVLVSTDGNTGNIMKSIDGGITFNTITSADNIGNKDFRGMVANDDFSKIVVTVHNSFVYHTTDGGANWAQFGSTISKTWDQIASNPEMTKFAVAQRNDVDATQATILGAIWYTLDYGISWHMFKNAGRKDWMGVAASPDYTQFIASDAGNGDLYNSIDSGDTWNILQAKPGISDSFTYVYWTTDLSRVIVGSCLYCLYSLYCVE